MNIVTTAVGEFTVQYCFEEPNPLLAIIALPKPNFAVQLVWTLDSGIQFIAVERDPTYGLERQQPVTLSDFPLSKVISEFRANAAAFKKSDYRKIDEILSGIGPNAV